MKTVCGSVRCGTVFVSRDSLLAAPTELFLSNFICTLGMKELKKVKFSRYRFGVAQRVGRGIALLFHDRGTRRE